MIGPARTAPARSSWRRTGRWLLAACLLLHLGAALVVHGGHGPWPVGAALAAVGWGLAWSVAAVLCAPPHGAVPVATVAALLGVGCSTAAVLGSVGAPAAGIAVLAVVLFVLLPFLALVLPDGVGRVPGALTLGVLVAFAVPAAVHGVGSWAWQVAFLVALTAAVAAMWWRFERGDRSTREALLWVAVTTGGAVLVLLPLAFFPVGWLGGALAAVALLVVPAGVVVGTRGAATLDARTVVVGTVSWVMSAMVALAVFSGAEAWIDSATDGAPPPGSLALLAVGCAAGFAPLRALLDGVVVRLVVGDRIDPVRAAAQFADGLSTADDPAVALRGLRDVLGLPSVVLTGTRGSVATDASTAAAPPAGTYELPLRVGERTLGALVIGLRPGELGPTARDRAVLRIVVPALAQAVHARALADELQASRERVVTAVEDDRRRLRHDLHDGLGPTLTGVAYAADAARNLVRDDPDAARELLADLRADTAAAIDEVRRLVDGLRPAALDEVGLVAALRQHGTHLHTASGDRLVVGFRAPALPPLSAATEVAVFRIVTEALTNVARHAAATRATVRITAEGGLLRVEVVDDGSGDARWRPGVGLDSMRERAELLGGTFTAAPGPRGGLVVAELPLEAAEA